MDENIEVLNELYKNAKMGEESIKTLLPSVGDQKMRSDLETQRNGYLDFCDKAWQEISSRGDKAPKINPMVKVSSTVGIKMNTLTDKSDSHIADMMIQGSTMGITSATEGIHKHPHASQEVLKMAKDVVKFEQNNIERMKEYL